MGFRTWLYRTTGIRLGKLVFSDRSERMRSYLQGDSSLGDHSYIQSDSFFFNVHIGRYCSIAPNVTLGGPTHPTRWLSTSPFQYNKRRSFQGFRTHEFDSDAGSVIIENDVWIGRCAIVLPGVKICTGAIVGAGAVVTKDVPPYAVVVGVPAKIIRYRFDEETIRELLELKWWELEIEELNGVNFSNVNEAISQIKQIKAARSTVS